jgi:hypothetical protein
MTDWQQVFAPMEQALAEMLAQSEATFIHAEAEPPLSGAVPVLDEVLAPVSRVVARAEEHARAAELHAEDATSALAPWRERAAVLLVRLAQASARAV